MSTAITPTSRTQRIAPRELAASRQPWVHNGVASERVHRAERAYAAELAHAEHHARVRAAGPEGAR